MSAPGGPPPGGPPLPPDETRIGTMLAPVCTLLVISTTLLFTRLYSRIRPVMNLGWDDAIGLVAAIASILQIAFLFAAIPHGLGRHIFYVAPEDGLLTAKLIFISQFPWGWAVSCAKISIALLLLRFKRTKSWRIFLYLMIALQVVLATVANIVQLAQCKPIAAQWDPTIPGAQCWDPQVAQKGIYVQGSLSVLSDVILSIIPITFLKELQRPMREKIVLSFLMGLGVFTASAVVVKMTVIGNFGNTKDPMWDVIELATWSIVEAQIGIIAMCVPTLKAPMESILRRVGLLTKRTNTHRSGYINAESGRERSQAYRMNNVSAFNNSSRTEAQKTNFSPAASESSILPQDNKLGGGY
ncbi:hypothetical protein V8F06_011114 [Rhypophila decipiens]